MTVKTADAFDAIAGIAFIDVPDGMSGEALERFLAENDAVLYEYGQSGRIVTAEDMRQGEIHARAFDRSAVAFRHLS